MKRKNIFKNLYSFDIYTILPITSSLKINFIILAKRMPRKKASDPDLGKSGTNGSRKNQSIIDAKEKKRGIEQLKPKT
jgi:hypothetical protein